MLWFEAGGFAVVSDVVDGNGLSEESTQRCRVAEELAATLEGAAVDDNRVRHGSVYSLGKTTHKMLRDVKYLKYN